MNVAEQEFKAVREERISDRVPLYSHPEWRQRWPWLLQATTGRASGDQSFDLSFFGQATAGDVMARWHAVRQDTGFSAIVHARQVHAANVLFHKHAHRGINVGDDADGHVTPSADALLAVSIADCVPISIVDEQHRSIALLHAGWRGVAAGILKRGIDVLVEKGSALADLHVHLGPAICGKCYEVGPEVFAGVGEPVPTTNSCINLRAVLARNAAAFGIDRPRITISAWCTRCDADKFYSHRGGARERQMALLGVRP